MVRTRMLASAVLAAAVALVGLVARDAFAQIGQVRVDSGLARYDGKCPAHITFAGHIAITTTPITLNYHWESNDGKRSQVQVTTVHNSKVANLESKMTWNFGTKGKPSNVVVKLVVASGNQTVTGQSPTIAVNCR